MKEWYNISSWIKETSDIELFEFSKTARFVLKINTYLDWRNNE